MKRKAAMEATMQETENYSKIRDYQTTVTILEHLSDAVFILSPDGNIQYANRVATDLLGKPLSDLLAQNLNDFLGRPYLFDSEPEVAEEEQSFLQDIYRSGLREIESNFKVQGYEIPVLLSFGMVRNKNDEVQYIIVSAKDLSLRKNLEKERMQKQLLAQSRDRYRELGELAINIVHRLSQPITSIQLLTDVMQKGLRNSKVNSEQMLGNLQQINEILNGMSEVINNVRNFAFLTEEESMKPVDLEKVIKDALQQLHYELTEANLTVNIQRSEQLPGVLANALNLQQVFMTIIRFYLEPNLNGKNIEPLNIRLQNVNNHWIEAAVYQGSSVPSFSLQKNNPAVLMDENINLTVVQLILTSFGGDFAYLNQGEHAPAFILRLPADQQDERNMLLNLIELMK